MTQAGGVPVLVDISEADYNIDVDAVENAAIFPGMTEGQATAVVETIVEFFENG